MIKNTFTAGDRSGPETRMVSADLTVTQCQSDVCRCHVVFLHVTHCVPPPLPPELLSVDGSVQLFDGTRESFTEL